MIIDPYRLAGAAGDITTSQVDWYKFDEGSGTSAANSGSSTDGLTWFGGSWTTGVVGTYAHLTNYGGGPRNATNLNLSGDQFFGFWYKESSADTNGRVMSFCDTTHTYRLMVVKNHTAPGEIGVASSDGSGKYVSSIGAGWHHVMAAYTNGVLSAAYWDNVLMTNSYGSGTFGSDPTGGRCFGNKNDGNNTTASYIDDFHRYTRILTSTDRAALFALR